MKICLLGDATSIHLQRLALGQVSRGHQVHIITHKPATLSDVTVERFQIPRAGITNLRRWQGRWTNYLRDIVRRFDVVNVHFLSDWGLTPEVMAEGVVIATAWGSDIAEPPGENAPTPELLKARLALLQHATAVTTCGPAFAKMVADFGGIDRDRIEVVPFGVDLGLFDPDGRPSPQRRSDGTSLIGFYKGFREVYGASYLIRAIPKVLDRCPAVRFELIGDGPELNACQSLAQTLGVSQQITWIPRQDHHQLPSYLCKWHISVIPSVHEAFGVAALESLAMRVPVVATHVDGLVDTVIPEKTGLLVSPGAPDALAKAMVDLVGDDSRRKKMGEAGRQWVMQRFEQSKVNEMWEAFYHRVLDRACVMA